MSNFLDQFDGNSYKKNEEEVNEIENKEKQEEKRRGGIIGPEHEIKIDPEYKSKKRKKYIILGIISVLVIVLIILFVRSLNRVTVIDFVGEDVSDVKIWALKNNITLDTKYVYSNEYSEDIVTSQSIKAKKVIFKKDILSIEVSKGTNLEEKINLPDFTAMDYYQIRDWIDENKLSNSYVVQQYSDTIEKNKFIKKVFDDEGVDEKNFKRKDTLTIYVSKGKEQAEKNITVIDFTNKTKAEADTWGSTNEIKIKYLEVSSDTIADGLIASQNIKAGELLAKGDSITLNVSIGKVSIVPDFSNVMKEDAPSVAGDITVTVKTVYSDTVEYGKLISQSVQAGTKLYKSNKFITLVYSEGKPFIDNLVGKSEKELPAYFYEFNTKGTEITYNTVYVDSKETKGTVVWTSKSNEYIPLKANIIINVSKGNLQ